MQGGISRRTSGISATAEEGGIPVREVFAALVLSPFAGPYLCEAYAKQFGKWVDALAADTGPLAQASVNASGSASKFTSTGRSLPS
ncbi:hypothetical protein T261_01459 [Streptomyces lydicus]|nr:hypothetical protein T261_01459 [Streptomyces lydicus]